MVPLFAYYFRFCSANCFAQQTTFPQIHGGILEYLLSFINISPQKDLLSSSDNQQYVLLSFLLNFFLLTVFASHVYLTVAEHLKQSYSV